MPRTAFGPLIEVQEAPTRCLSQELSTPSFSTTFSLSILHHGPPNFARTRVGDIAEATRRASRTTCRESLNKNVRSIVSRVQSKLPLPPKRRTKSLNYANTYLLNRGLLLLIRSRSRRLWCLFCCRTSTNRWGAGKARTGDRVR